MSAAVWRVLTILAGLAAIAGMLFVMASPGGASTTPRRLIALQWAEAQAGKWYCFGGTGPGCFDCSGLVMSAYRHAGVTLPRTTYGMIGSTRLVRIAVSQAQRGDLMFFGSGHVELKTLRGTFGAQQTGTRIGWHHPSGWWVPTMAFRLRW